MRSSRGQQVAIVFAEEIDLEDVGDVICVITGGSALIEFDENGGDNLLGRDTILGWAHNEISLARSATLSDPDRELRGAAKVTAQQGSRAENDQE